MSPSSSLSTCHLVVQRKCQLIFVSLRTEGCVVGLKSRNITTQLGKILVLLSFPPLLPSNFLPLPYPLILLSPTSQSFSTASELETKESPPKQAQSRWIDAVSDAARFPHTRLRSLASPVVSRRNPDVFPHFSTEFAQRKRKLYSTR